MAQKSGISLVFWDDENISSCHLLPRAENGETSALFESASALAQRFVYVRDGVSPQMEKGGVITTF